MSNSCSDYFSESASLYATYRPRYPASLFAWLAGQVPNRTRAWDCGTGSGQAAEESRRVTAPGGVALAVWTYGQVSIDAGIDERIGVFYREELATTGRWSVHSWTQAGESEPP